jgi:predicted dehydrogenase
LTSADRIQGPVTVGVVGCGHVARKHFAALRRLGNVRIIGAGAYGDLDAMLEERRPDVVHILTPPQSHCELGLAAMRAGCHVLVEKPLAITSGKPTR